MGTIQYRFLTRGGTAAALASVNEVPLARELVFETDTLLFKLGDGATHYNALPYLSPTLTQKQILARKSATSGRAEACSLSDILDFVGSANGDLLYRTGGVWARLPISSNGNVLTVSGGLPVWGAGGSGGGGGVAFVAEVVVSGSAATTLSLTGLDLTTDQEYILLITYKNAAASTSNFSLYFNGDTTDANYKRAGVNSGAAFTASNAFLGATATSEVGSWTSTLRMDSDGRPNFLGNSYKATSAGVLTYQSQAHWWTTVANLTQLTLSSSVASGLAIGTKMTLYKRSH